MTDEAIRDAREAKAWADYAQAVMEFWNSNKSGPAVWTEKTEAARTELREAIVASERARVEALVARLDQFTSHGFGCSYAATPPHQRVCTCGLTAARRAALDAVRAGGAS